MFLHAQNISESFKNYDQNAANLDVNNVHGCIILSIWYALIFQRWVFSNMLSVYILAYCGVCVLYDI